MAVALANTLFFAAAKADSTGKVLLYLLLTVAPFAVIAPLIGPLLDRIQTGRRVALAVSSFGRALLALVMAINFDSWVIYPCALGMLVLSKSFGVLKAALTPRVLPRTDHPGQDQLPAVGVRHDRRRAWPARSRPGCPGRSAPRRR